MRDFVYIMGTATFLLAALTVVLAVSYSEASHGNCPLPSKVYGCSPKCTQDYECGNGKVCCTNACNAKSCTISAPQGTGTGSSSKHGNGAGGVYCDNVKCSTGEICKMDRNTKRNKCSRS